MKKLRVGLLAVFALLAACKASLPPAETTADGLVRVPSRPEGGVYRNLDADFTRYKRLMIEPLTVEFLEGWRKQHPDVSDHEVRRIEAETTKNFGEAFSGILVDEGPFEIADVRAADVLVVVPRMLDLKIPAPETESDTGFRSYSPQPVSLQMTGELRDGVNGNVLLRVIMIDSEDRSKITQAHGPNRVSNAREIRDALERWSRLVREAIDVARASKPR
ncbi:MAG TPA: hypothetical protein VM146_10510 [Steroidobacteraceae bacterium]|nr:hypothetical protein [Steroidobacteraceae bacterium]